MLLALSIEDVAMSPRLLVTYRTRKGKKRDPSLEPQEGSSFVGLLQTSDLHNYKVIYMCGLKPLNLW